MENHISENLSAAQKPKEEAVKLSETQKEFLNKALDILDKNPDIAEKVNNDFQKNLDWILQNPDKFKELLNAIDANMHAKINEISHQVDAWEIYASEWKKEAKEIVVTATNTKLEAVKKWNSLDA